MIIYCSLQCIIIHMFVCSQLKASAADSSGNVEAPMDIVVVVIDQNDNSPIFEKDTYLGSVPEASPRGTVYYSHLSL